MTKHAPNPRRAELAALSRLVRPLVKKGAYPNVNAAILARYREDTGETEWRTFKEWRDLGRPVKKGERGFPIWASPRAAKPREGQRVSDLAAAVSAINGIEIKGREWFPVAYLFHAGQVEARPQSPLFGEEAAA